ncbi:hypothetical protein MKW98_016613, partial [Papaver atlanticum]
IPGPHEWREKFVTIDNRKRVKQLQQIQGGYLDMGFSLSTVQIDLDDKNFEANARLITVDSMWGMAKSIVKYVLDNKAKQ